MGAKGRFQRGPRCDLVGRGGLAVLEMAASRDRCVEPRLKELLTQITEDEMRHAQFAWGFVAWMCRADESYLETVRSVIAGYTIPEVDEHDIVSQEAQDWGLLGEQEKRQIAVDALERVIHPCAATLLDGSQRSQAVCA